MMQDTTKKDPEKYSELRKEDTKVSCVVLTYSVRDGDLEKTINYMHDKGTSVHHMIDKDGTIYNLHRNENQQNGFDVRYLTDQEEKGKYVPINDSVEKTYYAGSSNWKGKAGVNEFGIGIMFINDAKSDFTQEQMTSATELLKNIQTNNPNIDLKDDLVGLGEVAARHVAPGKLFFWQKLAEAGLGQFVATTEQQKDTPSTKTVVEVQEELKYHGYGIQTTGVIDEPTSAWYQKFNNRYVPGQEPANIWTEASQHVFNAIHPEYQEESTQATLLAGDTSISNINSDSALA